MSLLAVLADTLNRFVAMAAPGSKMQIDHVVELEVPRLHLTELLLDRITGLCSGPHFADTVVGLEIVAVSPLFVVAVVEMFAEAAAVVVVVHVFLRLLALLHAPALAQISPRNVFLQCHKIVESDQHSVRNQVNSKSVSVAEVNWRID